jgi:probable HAF family extracellular repeat protein
MPATTTRAVRNGSKKILGSLSLLGGFICAVLPTASAPAGAAPAIYNLGGLPGGAVSAGSGVNDAGQVAGSSNRDGGINNHAIRYDGTPGSGGVMLDLHTFGAESVGAAVNNAGQVAGWWFHFGVPGNHAFRYDGTPGSDGVMHDLGTLGGADADARAINDSGQVTGGSAFTPGATLESHAYRYDGTPGSGGVMRDLGTLGGTGSRGYGINNVGQVTGNSSLGATSNEPTHAFRYDGTPGSGGVMRDLGTLGGKNSYGVGVNDAGQVAGFSDIAGDAASHAFRYDGTPGSAGIMRDLGTLGGMQSQSLAINNLGQVVGWSEITGSTIKHPFLYTGTPGAGGQMIDLDAWLDTNNPAEGTKWTLIEAASPTISISNNTGWITGVGVYDPDGPGGVAAADRAYLLDASALVPEAGGLALFAFGGMALLRRRRRDLSASCNRLTGIGARQWAPEVILLTSKSVAE